MMRSEKIAGDVNEANEELSGAGSPIPGLASLLRRLDRRRDEVPGLLDGAIERLDVALDALSDAQTALDEALRRIELWAATGLAPAPGDRVRLTAGCDKRPATCRLKFQNFLNFRGFPHLPPEDWLIAPRNGGAR